MIMTEIEPGKVDEKLLENKVKEMYRKVALDPSDQYHFEMGRQLAERLGYLSHILDKIPAPAIDSFAGVGYHFDLADLSEGQVVVDLGSGSGMDAFYAAEKVGKNGKVIGIDMTDAQLEKSSSLGNAFAYPQVWFNKGYIERVPIISQCVDVVISNGVINLSADKARVFNEASRILKKGGKLVISDIVSGVALPASIKCNATLWAACIGGAMQIDEYLDLIESAGMKIEEVKENPYQFLSSGAKGATSQFEIKSLAIKAIKQ